MTPLVGHWTNEELEHAAASLWSAAGECRALGLWALSSILRSESKKLDRILLSRRIDEQQSKDRQLSLAPPWGSSEPA